MMSTYRFILAFLLFVAFVFPSAAQVRIPGSGDATKLNKSVFGIGLAGGAASGIGLSFRHHLPSAISYQVTAGVVKASDKVHYDVGGELQYDFILASSTRVYAGVGFGFYYSGTSDKNDLDGPGRVGLGVGGEFRLTESFHCCVEGLFTYFTDGTILPLPQVGVFYYFL